MKKIIFVCFLSLTLCLGKPSESQATLPKATEAIAESPAKPISAVIPNQNDVPKPTTNATFPTTNTTPAVPSPTDNKQPIANKPDEKKDAKASPTKAITPDEHAAKIDTPTQKPEVPTLKPEMATNKSEVTTHKSEVITQKTDVVTEKLDTSTKKSPPSFTTEAPKTDKNEVPLQARGFDGPSFIGGIILSLGLLAIGFIGFKYYKNRHDMNYHTL